MRTYKNVGTVELLYHGTAIPPGARCPEHVELGWLLPLIATGVIQIVDSEAESDIDPETPVWTPDRQRQEGT